MTRVVVLAGGRSGEHEVSLVSGRGVREVLARSGYDVVDVTIDKNGVWTRSGREVALVPGSNGRGVLMDIASGDTEPIDVVFPALHGPNGEDGTVQGLCEMVRVPYVGAGVSASAISMDKAVFKTLALTHGLPVADAVVITAADWRDQPDTVRRQVAESVGYPCFCKPARLGSSVGISRVASADELDNAIRDALDHDDKILAEQAVPTPRELEIGLLGTVGDLIASPAAEMTYDAEWYDYETKYTAGRAEVAIPADIPDALTARLQQLAIAAFEMVDCHGLARVDFLVSPDGEVLLSELNTIPGLTPTSAYPPLMEAAGVPYPEVVSRLVELALERAGASTT